MRGGGRGKVVKKQRRGWGEEVDKWRKIKRQRRESWRLKKKEKEVKDGVKEVEEEVVDGENEEQKEEEVAFTKNPGNMDRRGVRPRFDLAALLHDGTVILFICNA